MAAPNVGPGKKRYTVTLTAANVERYQALLKQTGLAGSVSGLCDAAIASTVEQLQVVKATGTIKLSDVFNLIGKQMDLIVDEGRKTDVSEKREEKKPSRRKTTAKP